MSRIGSQPIDIPEGVKVAIEDGTVTVDGASGSLTLALHPYIKAEVKEGQVIVQIGKKTKKSSALWGTVRSRIANMVSGVTEGFSKKLELQGVGYKAQVKGKNLELNVGYSHSVTIEAPEGISFEVDKEIITVSGNDKVVVGQVAANIRKVRPPEPYKGKGIRYLGEHVRRKVGKVVGATE